MSNAAEARAFQILLLEDNAADAYLFRKALKDAGLNFELTVLENGADGLAFASREGKYAGSPIPDLAVLDLNVPKGDGASVLEAMRQNKDLSRVPVFIMSSTAVHREQAVAKEMGIERFITKPPTLEAFLQIGQVVKEALLKGRTPI